MDERQWASTKTNRLHNDKPQVQKCSNKSLGRTGLARKHGAAKTTCNHTTRHHTEIGKRLSLEITTWNRKTTQIRPNIAQRRTTKARKWYRETEQARIDSRLGTDPGDNAARTTGLLPANRTNKIHTKTRQYEQRGKTTNGERRKKEKKKTHPTKKKRTAKKNTQLRRETNKRPETYYWQTASTDGNESRLYEARTRQITHKKYMQNRWKRNTLNTPTPSTQQNKQKAERMKDQKAGKDTTMQNNHMGKVKI